VLLAKPGSEVLRVLIDAIVKHAENLGAAAEGKVDVNVFRRKLYEAVVAPRLGAQVRVLVRT
jgi:hypothetical protein